MAKSKHSSGRVTGSRAGAILGLSPWQSKKGVLRDMVRRWHGAEPEFKGNAATQWGEWKEQEARLAFMRATGTMVEEPQFRKYKHWLGAIADGLVYADGELKPYAVLEIKTPFKFRKDVDPQFQSAVEQPHYYAQLQTEMFCYQVNKAYFFQYRAPFDGHEEKYLLEEVAIDKEWIKENMPKLLDFYTNVFVPELENPDHLKSEKELLSEGVDPEIESIALGIIAEIDEIDSVIKPLEAKRKEHLETLKELARDESVIWAGRKFTKSQRVGSINYKKYFEDHPTDVDLDKYRGKGSFVWRLT